MVKCKYSLAVIWFERMFGIFYVDPLKFKIALLGTDEPEWAIRKGAKLGVSSWAKAKRGDQPLRPLTIRKLAAALDVPPESIIRCDEDGNRVEAVMLA